MTPRDVLALAGAEWRRKLRLQIVLTLFFCACYFTLQRVSAVPQHTFSPGRVDLMIGFDPRWVWVYQSAYVLMGIVPWLADSRGDLRLYSRGFLLLSCAGFTCFLVWPVAGPRPVDVPADLMYRFLVRYDAATNAFPSLHVGLTTYTVLFGARVSQDRLPDGLRMVLITTAVAWSAAIGYATIATKQHFAIDVPAGAVLAWTCHRWTWSRVSVRQRRINHAEAALDGVDVPWDSLSALEPGAGLAPIGGIARPDRNRSRPRGASPTQIDVRASDT